MSITYAGVDLGAVEDGLASWLEHWQPIHDLGEFGLTYAPPGTSTSLTFAAPPPPPPVRPGVLYWPRGAARYAIAHYVVTQDTLEDIRAATGGTASTEQAAQTLVLDDGVNDPVETALWMLPARPLAQVATVQVEGETPAGLWLLTLVDDRYYWWSRTADITVTEGTTTWSQLYAQVEDALGISVDRDSVASAYLKPGAGFQVPAAPIPLILDALAYNTGTRIVRDLGGTVRAVSSQDALDAQDTEWDRQRPRIAGGVIPLGTESASAYGSGLDLSRVLPSTVQITFQAQDSSPYPVVANLADLSLDPLPAPIPTVDGLRGWSCSGFADTGTPPSNQTSLDSLVRRFGADWARWQAGTLEATYAGVVAVPLSPLIDAIEWGMLLRDVGSPERQPGPYTRLYRPPWNDTVDSLCIACGTPPPPLAAIARVSNATADGNGYYGGILTEWHHSDTSWHDISGTIKLKRLNSETITSGVRHHARRDSQNSSGVWIYTVGLPASPGLTVQEMDPSGVLPVVVESIAVTTLNFNDEDGFRVTPDYEFGDPSAAQVNFQDARSDRVGKVSATDQVVKGPKFATQDATINGSNVPTPDSAVGLVPYSFAAGLMGSVGLYSAYTASGISSGGTYVLISRFDMGIGDSSETPGVGTTAPAQYTSYARLHAGQLNLGGTFSSDLGVSGPYGETKLENGVDLTVGFNKDGDGHPRPFCLLSSGPPSPQMQTLCYAIVDGEIHVDGGGSEPVYYTRYGVRGEPFPGMLVRGGLVVGLPTTSFGDIVVGAGGGAHYNLAIGTVGQLLTVVDSSLRPVWVTYTGTVSVTTLGTVTTGTWNATPIATAYIADLAITTAKIVDAAITTAKLADANVTTAKVADGAITDAKVASGLDASKLTHGTLDFGVG